VASAGVEVEGPASESVGVGVTFGGEQDGACAVDQECAQIGIAAFGDGTQVSAFCAGVFAWDQPEVAGEVASGGESGDRADETDQGCGGISSHAPDSLPRFAWCSPLMRRPLGLLEPRDC
jgi:hypothetical protein